MEDRQVFATSKEKYGQLHRRRLRSGEDRGLGRERDVVVRGRLGVGPNIAIYPLTVG